MARRRPATIDEYIRCAPPEGRPHLRKLYAILYSVAPDAEKTIKWNQAHCNFAPSQTALKQFRAELGGRRTTRNFLQLPYVEPLPEDLIRRIAEYRLREVQGRDDDSFW